MYPPRQLDGEIAPRKAICRGQMNDDWNQFLRLVMGDRKWQSS